MYNNYKLLNALISRIILDVQLANLMKFLPLKRKKFTLANKSKFCKFHQNYKHNTDEYVTLKEDIEALLRRSYLSSCNIFQVNGNKDDK